MGKRGSRQRPAKKPDVRRIVWDRTSRSIVVSADRSFPSLLARLRQKKASWVIVVRTASGPGSLGSEPCYYAYLRTEIERFSSLSIRPELSIQVVLKLHELMSSGVARRGQPRRFPPGDRGAASRRIIDFDAAGLVAGVGELLEVRDRVPPRSGRGTDALVGDEGAGAATPSQHRRLLRNPVALEGDDIEGEDEDMEAGDGDWDEEEDEGEGEGEGEDEDEGEAPSRRKRSGRGGGVLVSDDTGTFAPLSDEIEVVLSAEASQEIAVGDNEVVDFRIELTGHAAPLAASNRASAKRDVSITVSLSVENDALRVVRGQEQKFDPPRRGKPRTGIFVVKGAHTGSSRLAVTFRQGGTELGVIGLVIDVMEKEKVRNFEWTTATATALPRERGDDDKLALIIEQRVDNGRVFYQYILHSEALNLRFRRLQSQPLLDKGGGPAATPAAFVERIYQSVTKDLKTFDDLKNLQREARALGAKLCQELFHPDVARELWPLRKRIQLIEIVSWEPYIPWELVRLRDPASGDIDDRFLAEYGLVRTLSDADLSPEIPMKKWRYLGAAYPAGSFPPVGQELEYFTKTGAGGLRARGFTPVPIAAQRDDLYDVLADGDFDVLHISCHAESQHGAIEKASLIIGDERLPGATQPRTIAVDTITIEAEARLKRTRPLVFLNACETGRVGAVLTAWGGWPNVFLRAGASAFVGSAWAVRDKPAAAFSTAFYEALLNGETLSGAANSARMAAKQLGDVSWLAFKVFGHPRARRAA